jgi:hypothetical protein
LRRSWAQCVCERSHRYIVTRHRQARYRLSRRHASPADVHRIGIMRGRPRRGAENRRQTKYTGNPVATFLGRATRVRGPCPDPII